MSTDNGSSNPAPRRALIMAGGGLKVAFQAGVLQVWLDEARTPDGRRLDFELADAASGGVFNLAMWCQGLSGRQIADNWRRTQPFRGISINWRHWLPVPASIFTYDGFREQVFSRTWNLDWPMITKTGRVTSFNLFNVDRQQHQVRRASQMNETALVSAVTLPLWFPPVRLEDAAGEASYIDAIFATDANIEQAIADGADEVWVIWTVSQRGRARPGFTHGYFQMIEAIANSRIRAVLDRIERNNAAISDGQPGEFQRRIGVKWLSAEVPAHYLFSLSRASMEEAVNRGVIEGRRWCRTHGLRLEPANPPTMGGQVSFREKMVGAFAFGEADPDLGARRGAGADTELSLSLTVTVPDVDAFVSDRWHSCQLDGSVRCSAFGGTRPVTDGVLELLWDQGDPTWKWLSYRVNFQDKDGNDITLFGRKNVIHKSGTVDLWSDTTTLYVHLFKGRYEAEHSPRLDDLAGSGVIRISLPAFLRQLTTFRGTAGADGGRARSLFRFSQFCLRQLWQVYGQPGGPELRPRFTPPQSHPVRRTVIGKRQPQADQTPSTSFGSVR
jgi:predicted patatin/cPLA2 family phospholipase